MASRWTKVFFSAVLGAMVLGHGPVRAATPQLHGYCLGVDQPGDPEAMTKETQLLATWEPKAQLDADLAAAKTAIAAVDDLRQHLAADRGLTQNNGYDGAARFAKLAQGASDPVDAELFRRVARDQFARGHRSSVDTRTGWAAGLSDGALQIAFATLSSRDSCGTDADNTRWLKAQVATRGWFKRSTDGIWATRAAFLLVQHADRDRSFQKEVLEMVQPLLTANEVRPMDYALLFDRIATGEGRPQRYGSQGTCTSPHTWTEQTVEDPASLDERRASVGLGPEAAYRKLFERLCP